MFGNIKNWLLNILFPAQELPENLRLNDTLFCSVCRARLPENKKVCHKNAQYILGAAVRYDDRVKEMIWHLKYRNRYTLAEPLSNLLNTYIENCKLEIGNFVIVPIPLSEKRFRDRGYNQATLIAKYVSEKFGLPVIENALIRQQHSAPQAEIRGWDERKKNIAGCFGILRPELVEGRNIILMDDVFTSGATISEAAHQLKDFGAKKIIGLVIAKAG